MKKWLLPLTVTAFILMTAFNASARNRSHCFAGEMSIHWAKTDRGTFAYRESGNPDGFPIIMIHGWPESSYSWESVAAKIDPAFRVIAPDLRGLGYSERTMDEDAYHKFDLAQDMIGLVDHLGITSFNLVGHDWGAAVAQEVAIAVPDRVNKFVIMNFPIIVNLVNNLAARDIIYAQGGVPFWYQYFQQQPELPEAMIKHNENVWVSHFFKGRPIPHESIDQYIRAYKIRNTPACAASYYRTMGDDGMRWYELFMEWITTGKRFTMPTLYIYGNLDSVIIPEYLVGIEAWFDSIEVVEVDSAHFVQEEKPAEVAELMNNFF